MTPAVGQAVTLTVTRTITGTVTSVQAMGCTHGTYATQGGRRVWTTSHGDQPCPDRERPAALGIREPDGRRTWIYLTAVPGQAVTLHADSAPTVSAA